MKIRKKIKDKTAGRQQDKQASGDFDDKDTGMPPVDENDVEAENNVAANENKTMEEFLELKKLQNRILQKMLEKMEKSDNQFKLNH